MAVAHHFHRRLRPPPLAIIPLATTPLRTTPGAKATVHLEAGDRLRILTPGGGGFGPEGADAAAAAALKRRRLGGEGGDGGEGGESGPAAKRQAVALKGSVEEYRRAQETV